MNPAGADYQLLGVYSASLTSKVAQALRKLGTREAMVVHALHGMDEISVTGRTMISRLRDDGSIDSLEYAPADLSVRGVTTAELSVSSPEDSAEIALDILSGADTTAGRTDTVVVNAAAAIILGGLADDFDAAVPVARRSIESGAAMKKLEGLIRKSGGNMEMMEDYAST